MINFLKKLLTSSTVIAKSDRIKFGYSNGATDSSSPKEWRKP